MNAARRDGYTDGTASTSMVMTEHVLKDDQAVCTGSEMKLVLMNSARQVREKG